MITVELDSAAESLMALLDRCAPENIQDVTLRFPALAGAEFEPVLRAVLGRAFRFTAWFRGTPPPSLAELFLSNGRRLTMACAVSAHGHELESWRTSPVLAGGAPWQVSLFLAVPAPLGEIAGLLEGLELRRGSSLTLGLGWQSPDSGPSEIAPASEGEWIRVLREVAAWCTARGATVQLACGLPLCLFSTDELGELALLKIGLPLALCAPDLVVTLDGRARLCPLLPTNGWVAMPAGVPLNTLREQLLAPAKLFAGFCNRAGEGSCRSLATAACGGGCMARNALAWRGATSARRIGANNVALV